MKKIICIVGKTSSGKDTAAHYLSTKYNIPIICSYTTRKKRHYEKNGVEHYFISKEEAEKIKNESSLIAYTYNDMTDVEYFATLDSIPQDTAIYIINPDGIDWMRRHNVKAKIKVLYIDLSTSEILSRAKQRGDNMEVTEKRLFSEKKEYDSFLQNALNYSGYPIDYYINNSGSIGYLEQCIDEFMRREG